jgi:hypothetical protein
MFRQRWRSDCVLDAAGRERVLERVSSATSIEELLAE